MMQLLWSAILFMLSFVTCIQVKAQSNIVVFSPMGQHFYLSIDNKLQYEKPLKNIKVTAVAEGTYFITIDFWNKEIPLLKQSIQVKNGRELALMLKKDEGSLVLEEYSNVPLAQVNNVDPKQIITKYSSIGVAKVEVKEVENEPNIFVERSTNTPPPPLVIGNTTSEYDHKREGKFSMKEQRTPSIKTKTKQPDLAQYPQTIEKITYKTEPKSGGKVKIIEIKEITIKDVVERNGQKYVKTKKEMRERVTNYSCVPLTTEAFQTKMNVIDRSAVSPKSTTSQQFKNCCLTTEQANEVAKIVGVDYLNEFAKTANASCADAENCPWGQVAEEPIVNIDPVKEEPIAKVETEDVKQVVKEKEIVEEPVTAKTAKALKAELKAARKREKAAIKEAKRKAKAARKAEKVARKAAKKAARKAEKEKKKAEKS